MAQIFLKVVKSRSWPAQRSNFFRACGAHCHWGTQMTKHHTHNRAACESLSALSLKRHVLGDTLPLRRPHIHTEELQPRIRVAEWDRALNALRLGGIAPDAGTG